MYTFQIPRWLGPLPEPGFFPRERRRPVGRDLGIGDRAVAGTQRRQRRAEERQRAGVIDEVETAAGGGTDRAEPAPLEDAREATFREGVHAVVGHDVERPVGANEAPRGRDLVALEEAAVEAEPRVAMVGDDLDAGDADHLRHET